MASLDAAAQVVVLAGPGVAASGASSVNGLRGLAERAGIGVVNTYGAKGLFPWQSPYHLGTVGLQARDYELAGVTTADLVIATGLDSHETPPATWQGAPHVVVPPRQLAQLADRWPRPPGQPIRPALYTRIAEVVQPLYASERVPLSPARAVADLKAALPQGGALFADPGLAGFWVARTFPTEELGTVTVPAVREPGCAAWAAYQAARSGQPAVAVTTAPHDFETDDALAHAATAGVAFVLCVWGSGHLDHASQHFDRLRDAVTDSHVRIVEVPVAWEDTDLLIEVAGPITAWQP